MSPERLPQSWEWARRTLELIGNGAIQQHGIVHVEDHLTTLLLRGDESLSNAIVARWLAPLQRLSKRTRQGLPDTLLAWLAHQRSFTAAAADLHVHPHAIPHRQAARALR